MQYMFNKVEKFLKLVSTSVRHIFGENGNEQRVYYGGKVSSTMHSSGQTVIIIECMKLNS